MFVLRFIYTIDVSVSFYMDLQIDARIYIYTFTHILKFNRTCPTGNGKFLSFSFPILLLQRQKQMQQLLLLPILLLLRQMQMQQLLRLPILLLLRQLRMQQLLLLPIGGQLLSFSFRIPILLLLRQKQMQQLLHLPILLLLRQLRMQQLLRLPIGGQLLSFSYPILTLKHRQYPLQKCQWRY